MSYRQIKETGCRITGAITGLGNTGPKHHGVIIGRSEVDGKVYVAENMTTGYQLRNYDTFVQQYCVNDQVFIHQLQESQCGRSVAIRALKEISRGGNGRYNLLTNNCESFANRAIHKHSVSSQVVTTFGVALFVVAGIYALRKAA